MKPTKPRAKPKPAPSTPPAGSPFLRLWESQPMIVEVARYLVSLRFTEDDHLRIRDLLERNRESVLSREEARELDEYESVSLTMSIMQLRAKRLLAESDPVPRRG